MKKRTIALFLALILFASMLSGCIQRSGIPGGAPQSPDMPQDHSEPAPPNADEILREIQEHLTEVNCSAKVQDFWKQMSQTDDPDEIESLRNDLRVHFESLFAAGIITDFVDDTRNVSLHYKVDGIPVTMALYESDASLSGGSDEVLMSYPYPTPEDTSAHKADNIHIMFNHKPKLKALVLSWDDQPYTQRSLDEILAESNDYTHWDLAQIYKFRLEAADTADITVEKIDDFVPDDLTPEKLGQYDLIYFNTHGYLSGPDGDTPYFLTGQDASVFNYTGYWVWDHANPSLEDGIEIFTNNSYTGVFHNAGRFAVGAPYFQINFPLNSLKAKWVHLGCCKGMAGNNQLATILRNKGAVFVSGYDDDQMKMATFAQFEEMLPVLLNTNSFEDAIDAGRNAIDKYNLLNNKAKLQWTPNSTLKKSLFCGFKLWLVTDQFSSGIHNAEITIEEKSPGGFANKMYQSGLYGGTVIGAIGLNDGGTYRVRINAPGYEPVEIEVRADWTMDTHEILLHYTGDTPVPEPSPAPEGNVNHYHLTVVDFDSNQPVQNARVEVYGRTPSSDFELLVKGGTDAKGEFDKTLPEVYNEIYIVIYAEGYKSAASSILTFTESHYLAHTVKLEKDSLLIPTPPAEKTPAPGATPAPSGGNSQDAALRQLLTELTGQYGVMQTGTDYIESDVATDPIKDKTKGILFADIDDYDRDGTEEVMLFRNDPVFERYGSSNDHLTIDIYEFRNGSYTLAGSKDFLAYGLSSTYNNHSMTIFKYGSENDFGKGIFIGIELYGQMNSQNTSVVILNYDGEDLNLLDGANYGEWDGSDNMKSSFSVPSGRTDGLILDRNGDGFGDWKEQAGSGTPLDERVLNAYRARLRTFGLDLKLMRSIYTDYNGTNGLARNSAYCNLTAKDCYTPYKSSDITELGVITTEYGQNIQTLTRKDLTGLLSPYR